MFCVKVVGIWFRVQGLALVGLRIYQKYYKCEQMSNTTNSAAYQAVSFIID